MKERAEQRGPRKQRKQGKQNLPKMMSFETLHY